MVCKERRENSHQLEDQSTFVQHPASATSFLMLQALLVECRYA